MANSTLVGNCIAPFLDAAQFSSDGGFIDGRFCAPIDELPGHPTCCLPCPATRYAYSDSFNTYNVVSEWLNVLGLILLTFMLISYVVLPAQQTRSHYLSVCLVVSVMMITLGFAIPLGARPQQCYDAITPNDMYTSNACAWGGAFIIAGGLTAMMWIFIRALSMNLQICWDIVPGRKFFYISQLAGWGVPAILFTITITITGVSFRFGNACHVNHENSMGDFWGPLLAMAGMAAILQVGTFGYCIHVYLKNLWTDGSDVSTNASSGGLPSYQGSVRTMTARAVYRRLKKVLWLQWRGICIVSIVLVDVIFFSIVFVSLDGMQTSITNDWEKVKPWLFCLAQYPNDKNKCLPLVQGWLVNEPTVVAVLLLLALMGLQVFLLLTRPSFFPAWWDYFRSKVSPKHQEFVSLDARPEIMRSNSNAELLKYQRGHQATTFEMQSKSPFVNTADLDMKNTTSSTLTSPDDTYRSPLSRGESPAIDPTAPTFGRGRIPSEYIGRITPSPGDASVFPDRPTYQTDYFDPPTRPTIVVRRDSEHSERRYRAPNSSFAQPNAPSRASSTKSVSFDPRDTYSRGGLALNPPSEAGESQEDVSKYGHGYDFRNNRL
ncbi:hypothetical protein HII31_03398 [Pseudocercospora fuligena]|uniref:G-protein coupled receptors family 2 profile 2 domain-containing protein n=1 Tax=Pseudocercospora fuligena TaxID=685502 RepID=A0A8H6VLZ4_9PEZI|nr:hypothetical protein HII31_03398 [Pseudocercospora fuligena]